MQAANACLLCLILYQNLSFFLEKGVFSRLPFKLKQRQKRWNFFCHFKRGDSIAKNRQNTKISKLERGRPENKHAFWGEKGQRQN